MSNHNEFPDDKLNRLRAENEEKKRKMTEEYGAFFSGSQPGCELSPEIESQFLDNIMAFENAFDSGEPQPLYDFIGCPPFRKPEDVPDAEMPGELDRVLGLLNDHQVLVDTICDVPDRELYRFITEELFWEEMYGMQIPGMNTHFIYEEFHPNHEHDIQRQSIDFMRFYLDKENDIYLQELTSKAQKEDWHVHFRQAFSSFRLNDFCVVELKFDTEKATVQFECDFVANIEGDSGALRFEGTGEFVLLCEWGYWNIDAVRLPRNRKI